MTTTPPPSDRRTRRRRPLQVRVDFKVDERVGRALSVDISEGGIFLNTNQRVPAGARIYLRLQPGAGKPEIKLVGEVRRVVAPGEGPLPGLGVAFETAFSEDRHYLHQFLTGQLKQRVTKEEISNVAPLPGLGESRLSKYVFEKKGGAVQARPKQDPSKSKEPRSKLSDFDALKALDFEVPRTWLSRIPWKVISLVGAAAVLYFALSKVLDLLLAL